MNRNAKILGDIDKTMLGIEVAPWFAPIASKAEGYNVRTLDVFDKSALIARAKVDPNLVDRDMGLLEEVDYVGSATEIATLVASKDHGTFDYIVSSHNFEHIPNPIKFLQGCEQVLKSGGVLSMAVPDRRACFDYFRPNTQIGDWLDAYADNRNRPTARQVFDLRSKTAYQQQGQKQAGAFSLGAKAESVGLSGDLNALYQLYYVQPFSDEYQDAHCTVMTPNSLELLLTEARQLGLINCTIEHIGDIRGCEFYVRLRFGPPMAKATPEQFLQQRLNLQHRVLQDYIPQVVPGRGGKKRLFKTTPLTRKIRSFGRKLRGKPDH
jgi:Methyltransferase domain